MSSAQNWVAAKLAETMRIEATIEPISRFGLRVTRSGMPAFTVFCAAVDDGNEFGADELDHALQLLPQAEFVIAVPNSRVAHSAYERADEIDVAFGGLGDLENAIMHSRDVTTYLDRAARYDQSRILAHRGVIGMRRRGRNAWEIRRKRPLPPLTIVTQNPYEFTAEQMRTLVLDYRNSGIPVDAVVVTNSACSGFSSASMRAAREAGVSLQTINDFLGDLDRR